MPGRFGSRWRDVGKCRDQTSRPDQSHRSGSEAPGSAAARRFPNSGPTMTRLADRRRQSYPVTGYLRQRRMDGCDGSLCADRVPSDSCRASPTGADSDQYEGRHEDSGTDRAGDSGDGRPWWYVRGAPAADHGLRYRRRMGSTVPGIDSGARQRLSARFGSEVEAWFDELPGVLAALARRWQFELGSPIPPSSPWVTRPCGHCILSPPVAD